MLFEIVSGKVSKDHLHLFVSLRPKTSVEALIQQLKDITSYKLIQLFQPLQSQYPKGYIWADNCFCMSSGDVTDEEIKTYIENQGLRDGEDRFKTS
jgi:putative transposase